MFGRANLTVSLTLERGPHHGLASRQFAGSGWHWRTSTLESGAVLAEVILRVGQNSDTCNGLERDDPWP